ncbi:MAG: cysteine hydrolase family protein [Sphingobacteriales bacterium]
MEQNTQNTALLVMDMQKGTLGMMPGSAELISNVAKAIANARDKKMPVIYVVVGFRQGAPEINMSNKSFATGKERFAGINMDEFMEIHPEIAPAAGELTVIKRRISAFTGSDLEVVLRAFGIRHLVLTGVATSGVVLSTTREAADKDFLLTILADGCADRDEEVHQVLTTKIFPRQADVLSVDEWCKL